MKKNYSYRNQLLETVFSVVLQTGLFRTTKQKMYFLALFGVLGITGIHGQTIETITTTGNGTWVVPCGVTNITVEAWGGGGAGGGSTSNNNSGAGGGSGAYTSRPFTVTPGTPINYTVGAGGNGSTGNGGNGENTTILGMIAGRGTGGERNGGTVGTRGTATGGTINTNGNNGTAGGTSTGGNGGNAPNGGNGGTGRNNNNGNPGATPGGGGGGGERDEVWWWFIDTSGGNGGDGQIRITYITSTPAVPATPTSNSPQCNPPGVTLTRAGTPPTGVTWYWQTAATGTDMSFSGATFIATTTGTYYLRARNNTSGCWSNGAGSRAVTVSSTPATVTSPTPTNGATGVCYNGTGAITAISWAASAGATNYDVYFGAGSLPGGITATVTTNSYSFGTLTPNTTYYWRVVARNACGSAASSATFTFTTSATPICYCTPTTSQNLEHITGVASEGTINDVSNPSGYSVNGYGNYTSIIIATQIPGGGININLSLTDITTFERQFVRTWVDWNNDGDFDDPGELVYTTGTTAIGSTSYGFLVPAAQALGDYRMRIKTRNYGDSSSYNSCDSYARGETEDYTIRVIADCPAKITGITPGSACGPTNTVTLSATMSAGSTQIRWYDALTGGSLVGTGASFTTPVLSSSTTYYVTASNGSCETIHKTPIKATILSTTDITITPSVPEVCGEDNVVSISALGDNITETIHTQDFESGLSGYAINTTGDTTPTSGAAPDAPWSIKTSPYQTTTNVWKPAINSGPVGTVGNRFAFTTSDYSGTDFTTTITSPAINVSTYTSLTLTFDHFFSRYVDDLGTIQASIDNGATWSTVNTFTAKDGSASKFKPILLNLTPYTGTTQLRIRFVYYGSYDDGWAIDNIKIEGVRPLNTLFTWTGATVAAFADAACTVPYTNQPVTTVYVKPTPSQLAMPSWSFTANATLGNGCIISTPVTITNKTKLWKGTTDNNWYNPNNWEPTGIPDANTCVYVYPGSTVAANTSNINTAANDGFAKVVTVRPSGVLIVHPNNDLTVTDAVTVDAGGTFIIENSGSLIQVNGVANSGIMNMERTANIRKLDYVYWSSPVTFASSFSSGAISPLSPTNLIFKWTPTIGSNVNGFGNWTQAVENMAVGKGYIVRGPNTFTGTAAPYTATFIGTPNNGTITAPIQRGIYDGVNYDTMVSTSQGTKVDDNWNLLGNPYPSAINAKSFLTANTNIDGQVKIWTHGTLPNAITIDPFYNDYVYNYTVNDYITYNSSGASTGPGTYNGYIPAGQGFFVSMLHGTAATNETVQFNNTMRSSTYNNSVFYRTAEENSATNEEGRIWLDIVNANGLNVRTLVAYVDGATNERDRLFDAFTDNKTDLNLYSNVENEHMIIQGRRLPFEQNDQVPMGIKVAQDGTYTITIAAVEGLFSNASQTIYIEDTQTNIIHDLRQNPYSFSANAGNHPNRFVLRYTNETLGTNDLILDEASVWVFSDHSLTVKSSKNEIQSVRVFDLLGRALAHYPNVNSMEVPLTTIQKNDSGLIIQVTLSNGTVVTKKTIY